MGRMTTTDDALDGITRAILALKGRLDKAHATAVSAAADIGEKLTEAREPRLQQGRVWRTYLAETVQIPYRTAYYYLRFVELRDEHPQWFESVATLGIARMMALCDVSEPFRYTLRPETVYRDVPLIDLQAAPFAAAVRALDPKRGKTKAKAASAMSVRTATAQVMKLQEKAPADGDWSPFLEWVQETWPGVTTRPVNPVGMTAALKVLISAARGMRQIPTRGEREELATLMDGLLQAIAELQQPAKVA